MILRERRKKINIIPNKGGFGILMDFIATWIASPHHHGPPENTFRSPSDLQTTPSPIRSPRFMEGEGGDEC